MGIAGLLPFLKSIQKAVHVSALKGKTVGVDAYCWLHKGSYSCATQIVMKTVEAGSLPLINYCLRRLNLLRSHDITPIVVFDGGYLPTKAQTEKERRQRRQSFLAKGKELLREGKKSEAHECFQKCVDISPEIALAFIKECRKLGVQCIVAPYEADAQLAYLSKEDIVDVVITEDSDLLVFGSKRVFFKMDESGNGKLIELKDLGRANKSLIGFTPDSFRQVCILSGCDYLPSVPGIGLGKATKLMRKHNQKPTQVIRALRCESSKVPSDYESSFKKAEYTFLYQLVFDPRSQKQVRLNDLPEGVDPSEFEFAGIAHSPKKAINMARGNINPITQEVMDMYSPSKAPPSAPPPPPPRPKSSSWSGSAMSSDGGQIRLPIQAKLPISSSQSSRRAFKPPRARRVAADEEAPSDQELLRMYTSPSSSSPPEGQDAMEHSQTCTRSEFFPSEAPSEDTDMVFEQQGHSSRKLDVEAATPTSDTSDTADTNDKIGLKGRPRKRLFEGESAISKLSRFANTKSKRHKIDATASPSSQPSVPLRNNPFSMAAHQLRGHVIREVDSAHMDHSSSYEEDNRSSCESDYTGRSNSVERISHQMSATRVGESSSEYFAVENSSTVDDEELLSIAETPQKMSASEVSTNLASSDTEDTTEISEFQSSLPVDQDITPPTRASQPCGSKAFTHPNSSKRLVFGKQSSKSSKKLGPKRTKSLPLSNSDLGQLRLGAFAFAGKPRMKL